MIGRHVPIIKSSFLKTIKESNENNIKTIQIFLRNPRSLKTVKYKEEEAEKTKKYIKENNLFVVSHATYLLNSSNKENFDDKIECALNDLIYAEKIGAVGSVFHVGKYLKLSVEEGTNNMYESISKVIEKLQEINSKSIYILETCAGQGTELLRKIEDLGLFFNRFTRSV